MTLSRADKNLLLICAVFASLQIGIIFFLANGPFLDEGIVISAGMRVLEGRGLRDGYATWFNGSPFLWPVFAGLGFKWGGLEGARLLALGFASVALLALGKAVENILGAAVAVWTVLAFALNGLFIHFAHFAVYDVPGLPLLAIAFWAVTEYSRTQNKTWLFGAGVASGFAVIAKYSFVISLPILLAVLFFLNRQEPWRKRLALIFGVGSVALSCVGVYLLVVLQGLPQSSVGVYMGQLQNPDWGDALRRQFYLVWSPALWGGVGLLFLHQSPQRWLMWVVWGGLFGAPAFHLLTRIGVSDHKHALIGFVFAYMLVGYVLHVLWEKRFYLGHVLVLGLLVYWGWVQWRGQEFIYPDYRSSANYLASQIKYGERIATHEPWVYAAYLYKAGLVRTPFLVSGQATIELGKLDICAVNWFVGTLDLPSVANLARNSANRYCTPRLVFTAQQEFAFTPIYVYQMEP